MEKEFIPYELALRMKQLRFDEPCFGYYNENALSIEFIRNGNIFKETEDSIYFKENTSCLAPTFSQAFRWFREKNFHVNIDSYHCLGKAKPFGLSIDYLHKSGKWDYIDYRDDADFETYEEAQKRAIEVIIEILENE